MERNNTRNVKTSTPEQDDETIANIADYYSPGWNKTLINNQSFDTMFQIEQIPLSWFLKRLLTNHIIPPQLNTRQLLIKYTIQETIIYDPTINKKRKQLEKLYYYNELAKIHLTKKNNKVENHHPQALFLTYTDHKKIKTGEIYRINQIVKQLQKENETNSNTTLNPFILTCIPSGKPFTSIITKQKNYENIHYSYCTREIINRSKQQAKKIYKLWASIPEEQKCLMVKSPSLWNCLRYAFDFYLSEEFITIMFINYYLFQQILPQQNIKVAIITSQNSIFERCLNAAASKQNIPTLLIQHGTGFGSINPSLLTPYHLGVFSEYYKKKLIEKNIPATKISITGAIMFHEFYQEIKQEREKKKNDQKTKPRRILIFTVPFIEQNFISDKEYFESLTKIIIDLLSLDIEKITIKLHPRENTKKTIKKYTNIIENKKIKEMRNIKKIEIEIIPHNKSNTTFTLLSEHEIIINFSSTTALEAAIFDKDIITIVYNTFRNPFNKILEQSKATIIATKDQNCSQIITNLWNEPKKRQKLHQNRIAFVKQIAGNIDEKTPKRITSLIHKLATHQNKTKNQ